MKRRIRPKIAQDWDTRACRIEGLSLKKDGDFFIVSGSVTNLTGKILPHLQLRLAILDKQGRVMLRDDFHLTDHMLAPGSSAPFRLEGEWREGMCKVQVVVCPHNSKRDISISPSVHIRIRELDSLTDELAVGEKRSVIQKGDIVFARADDVTDETMIFGSIVRYVTRSPFYHMVLYDHAGRFVHAGWPRVENNSLWVYFLPKPNITLCWGRPLYPDGRQVGAGEGARAIAYARTQIGKRYDIGANIPFVFRDDGLRKTPGFIRRMFRFRNRMRNLRRWQCSGIIAAAWFHASGITFTDNVKDIIYLSPADMYESIYCRQICTLKIVDGKPRLLTKHPVPARLDLATRKEAMLT